MLYPGVFPNLAALTAARADLVAILLTGLPSGSSRASRTTPARRYADVLRLNMAIPPTASPNPLGLVGGDAGRLPERAPRVRRRRDDRAAGDRRALTYPLVDKRYTPDAAASLITDGLDRDSTRYLAQFPYLGTPQSGYADHAAGGGVRGGDGDDAPAHG